MRSGTALQANSRDMPRQRMGAPLCAHPLPRHVPQVRPPCDAAPLAHHLHWGGGNPKHDPPPPNKKQNWAKATSVRKGVSFAPCVASIGEVQRVICQGASLEGALAKTEHLWSRTSTSRCARWPRPGAKGPGCCSRRAASTRGCRESSSAWARCRRMCARRARLRCPRRASHRCSAWPRRCAVVQKLRYIPRCVCVHAALGSPRCVYTCIQGVCVAAFKPPHAATWSAWGGWKPRCLPQNALPTYTL